MSAAYKQLGLLVLVTLLSQLTAVAQTTPPAVLDAPATAVPAGPTATLAPPVGMDKPAFTPYLAEAAGDNVNIRSGPAEVYYSVGQIRKGERFIVVDEMHGMKNWAKIKPTPQCFSYIARELVSLTDYPAGTAETVPFGREIIMGEIIGENVRVRAGSLKVPPAHASEVQTLLNQGAIVKIIGQRDDYYKIICPPNCYFWVSLDFVKRIGAVDDATAEELTHLASQDVLNPPAPDSPAAATHSRQERQRYLQAVEMLEGLQATPILQRDFTPVKAIIDELLQSQSPLIQRHARGLAKVTLHMEEAQQVVVKAQQQDVLLKTTLNKINTQLETLAAVTPPDGSNDVLVVQGTLGYSAIFTAPTQNRRFIITDSEDKIIYYAVSDNPGIDLANWVGKPISLTGRAEYDGFSKIRILHVQNLVEVPSAPKPAPSM